jgi:hypothetical protein
MSTVQAEIKNKGELISELRGKSVTTTIKEVTSFGVRLSTNGTAQYTGKYTASSMETVNVFMNRNGTSQYESKSMQNTMDGDFIVTTSSGTGKVTGPTTIAWEGDVVFMTQSQKLGWLNTTKGRIEGTTNNATGEYQAKIYTQK